MRQLSSYEAKEIIEKKIKYMEILANEVKEMAEEHDIEYVIKIIHEYGDDSVYTHAWESSSAMC